MKLSVMQENLARGLSVVSRAVSNRSTLPVLANVLLKTEDAGLKLTATNLEIGITYWVPGKIEIGRRDDRAGQAADRPGQLAAGRRAGRPRAPGAATTLHLRCGRFETHVKGIDADEFPAIQTAGERPTTRVAQNVLRQALDRDGVRGRQRRGPADPDRRPGPVRGRPADPRRRRQLPDRGQDDPDPRRRSRRRASSSRPGRSTSWPGSWPTSTTRSRSSSPRRATRSCSTSTGIDLVSRLIDGQFPNYQPVAARRATRPAPCSIARSSSGPSGRRR